MKAQELRQIIETAISEFYCPQCGGELAERVIAIAPPLVYMLEGAEPHTELTETKYQQKYSCVNGHIYAKVSDHRINRQSIDNQIAQAVADYLTSLELAEKKAVTWSIDDMTDQDFIDDGYNSGVDDCQAKLTAAAEELTK